MEKYKYDLQERLIDFTVMIYELEKRLPKSRAGNNLANQIVRSGTSPALNYGEACAAESRNDFKHTMKIILKELRETFVCLRIIEKANMYPLPAFSKNVKSENNELISIFVKSIKTVEKNSLK